ncbi:MAG: glycosyltransferase family 87 protein [bacterium]
MPDPLDQDLLSKENPAELGFHDLRQAHGEVLRGRWIRILVSRRLSPRLARLSVIAILILNSGLIILNLAAWGIAFTRDLFWRADFTSFYTGWAIVRDGRGAGLFDFDLQALYQQEILAGRSFQDGLLPFVNPPGLLLLFTPLANLPISTAFIVWTLVELALLAWLIALLWRISAAWELFERCSLILAVLAFPPMLITFLLGSFSLLMLVCILQMVFAIQRGSQLGTAFWFFIGAIKPQIMLVPGVMLASSRRLMALAWICVLGIGMVIVSSLLFGWQIWPVYFKRIGEISGFFGKFGFYPDSMVNFRGMLTSLLGSDNGLLVNQISIVALLIVSAAVFWIWRGPFQPNQPDFVLRMAFTLTLALLFNFHLNPQDGILYIVPAILFYDYLRQRGLPRRRFSAFALLCPYFFLFSEFFLGDRLVIRGQVAAALALLLWIGRAYLVNRRSRLAG